MDHLRRKQGEQAASSDGDDAEPSAPTQRRETPIGPDVGLLTLDAFDGAGRAYVLRRSARRVGGRAMRESVSREGVHDRSAV